VDRAKERRLIEGLLDEAKGGQSRVLVVRGDPGIGKTALLEHAIGSASGFQVARANGIESEMELAFAGLHQVCAPMLDRLALLPEPQREAASTAFGLTTGRPPDPFLIGLAVLSLLSEQSEQAPLLCVVDDAQWLDRASLQAFAFVARRLFADRIGLVFATREPIPDLLGLLELVVRRLGDADAGALLASVVRVPLDPQVRGRIIAETGGNPLALVEWTRGMAPAELASVFALPSLLPLSGRLEDSFRRRIADLPSSTQRLLIVAAAEPTGDAVVVWRAAAKLGVVAEDASPASEAGLLEIGARVAFRHPLIRSIAYRDGSVADRRAAHGALAEVTDPAADPDRRAWHRAEAAAGPDEEVAEELERSAARARARGGRAAAAALLERSVRLSVDPARRLHRTLAAASAKETAGDFEAALALLAIAEAGPLDIAQRAQADLVRFGVVLATGDAGDSTEALLIAAKGLETIDARTARRLYLYAFGSACTAGALDRHTGLQGVARAAKAAPVVEPAYLRDDLLDALAVLVADGLRPAKPLLQQVVGAYTTDDLAGAHVPHPMIDDGIACAAACVLWDFESLKVLSTRWVKKAREGGAVAALPMALNALASIHLYEGDLDGAASLIAEAELINEITGNHIAAYFAPSIAALRGGDDQAERAIHSATSAARAYSQGLPLAMAYWASATLHNGAGRYDQALAPASEAMRIAADWSSHLFVHELVEAGSRGGRPDLAAKALQRLSETTVSVDNDWALGIKARSEALVEKGATAETLYREAIERLARTALRPELARAHLLYGEWLRRENRRVDAREHLRTAYEQLSDIGMEAFAERARNELAATGETVRKRAFDTSAELTPQELQIARLAAEGRSNPQIGSQLFISARTVEWHLRKVFTKLNVASRKELRDALPGIGIASGSS